MTALNVCFLLLDIAFAIQDAKRAAVSKFTLLIIFIFVFLASSLFKRKNEKIIYADTTSPEMKYKFMK